MYCRVTKQGLLTLISTLSVSLDPQNQQMYKRKDERIDKNLRLLQ